MDENKELICKELAKVVRLTRAGADIANIVYKRYTDCEEEAIIYYTNDYIKKVNVSMDSGIAMIRDICKAIN